MDTNITYCFWLLLTPTALIAWVKTKLHPIPLVSVTFDIGLGEQHKLNCLQQRGTRKASRDGLGKVYRMIAWHWYDRLQYFVICVTLHFKPREHLVLLPTLGASSKINYSLIINTFLSLTPFKWQLSYDDMGSLLSPSTLSPFLESFKKCHLAS